MDIQNFIQISKYIFIITITFDAIVFIFVLLQKRLEKIHKWFLLMLGLFLVWEITLLGTFTISSSVTLNWWSDAIAFISGSFVTLSIIFFLEAFAEKKLLSNTIKSILVLISGINVPLVFIFLSHRIQYSEYAYDFYIPNTLSMTLYYLSFLPVSLCIGYVSYLIYKHSTGFKRTQVIITLSGLLIAFCIASITCVWFPLFFGEVLKNKYGLHLSQQIFIAIEFFGGLGLSFFTAFTAYAITRHRLFDIRVIIQSKYIRTIITLLAFVIVFAVAYMAMILTNNLWLFMLVALLGTLAVQFWLNRVFQRYLNQSVYDLSLPPELKLLDNTQIAVDKVFELVQQHLRTEFGARGSVPFIYDWLDKRYRSLNTEKPLLISEQHVLVRMMNATADVFTLAQLEQADNAITPAERDELLRFFHKHGYVMILPLFNSVMIYGFVAVTDMSTAGQNGSDLGLSDPDMRAKLLSLGQQYGYYLGQVLTYEALVRQGREESDKKK